MIDQNILATLLVPLFCVKLELAIINVREFIEIPLDK